MKKKRIKLSHEALYQHMAQTIARCDRVVIAVAASKKEFAFQYTVGNQEKGLPELLLIGSFKQEQSMGLLNRLSEMLVERREPFAEGEEVDLGGQYPMLIYSASEEAKRNYTIQAGQFYGNEDYLVQQVLVPDPNGCYPTDGICHKDYRVPVLKK